MKKFSFTINGNKYDVEINEFENNIAQIDVNGSHYEVEVHREVKASKTPTLVRAAVQSTKEERDLKTTAGTASVNTIKSPLPGIIMQIFIKEGDQVKIGQKLLTYEAMKMENEIMADRDGTIKSIKVAAGDNILEGQDLVEIA